MPFDYPAAGASPPPGNTEGEAMGLKKYDVTVNGRETTLLLSDADAKAQGLLDESKQEKAAPKPANKARRAPNKSKG